MSSATVSDGVVVDSNTSATLTPATDTRLRIDVRIAARISVNAATDPNGAVVLATLLVLAVKARKRRASSGHPARPTRWIGWRDIDRDIERERDETT